MYAIEIPDFTNQSKEFEFGEPIEYLDGHELVSTLVTNIALCLSDYDSGFLEEDKVYNFTHQPSIDIFELLLFRPRSYCVFNKVVEIRSVHLQLGENKDAHFIRYDFGDTGTLRVRVYRVGKSETTSLVEFDRFYTYTKVKELYQILMYLQEFYGRYFQKLNNSTVE